MLGLGLLCYSQGLYVRARVSELGLGFLRQG